MNDPDEWLAKVGFEIGEATALNELWTNDLIDPLLAPEVKQLREAGYSAAEALSASRHHLVLAQVTFYDSAGFTLHQGILIESNDQAGVNLFDPTGLQMDARLRPDLPRNFLINALLYADTPAATDNLIRRYHDVLAGTPQTHNNIVDTFDPGTGFPDRIEFTLALGGTLKGNIPNCCP